MICISSLQRLRIWQHNIKQQSAGQYKLPCINQSTMAKKKWYLIIDGVNDFGIEQRVRVDVNKLVKGLAVCMKCKMVYE